jgi:hypothetical protein
MKPSKVLLNLIAVICGIWELAEILLLPVLFLILGLYLQLPWQYYAITIGGYFGLLFLLQVALHLIFKWLGKKYSSRFARKAEKLIAKISRNDENSCNPPTQDN